MKEQTINNLKKLWRITANLLIALLGVLCILVAAGVITMKVKGSDTLTLFGYQLRIVQTASMEKSPSTDVSGYRIKDIPSDSLIIIEELPEEEKTEWYASIKVGDVLTFSYEYDRQYIITHRVISIASAPEKGGLEITLAGDNASCPDARGEQVIYTGDDSSNNYIIGKVTGVSYPLGWLLTNLRKPLGLVIVIIIPCLAMATYEGVKLVRILKASDKSDNRLDNPTAAADGKNESEAGVSRLTEAKEDSPRA